MLTRRDRYPPATIVAGWLPHGMLSTEPLRATIRRDCTGDWAPHPGLEAVATDFATGRRVVFGRPGSPRGRPGRRRRRVVRVPGFYRPVDISGRRYVDGGLRSGSNLDVLADAGLDLRDLHQPDELTAAPVAAHDRRAARAAAAPGRLPAAARGGGECPGPRRNRGPDRAEGRDLELMGSNMMARRKRHEVIESAIATVTEQLRQPALAAVLSSLPAGDPALVRRPKGAPERWPDLRALALARWGADVPRAA